MGCIKPVLSFYIIILISVFIWKISSTAIFILCDNSYTPFHTVITLNNSPTTPFPNMSIVAAFPIISIVAAFFLYI